ncbi:hypothetical protein Nepgr_029425 [Nepenthes gracilis]|uniref:t-SNARE coiled-coil homology domain-containing protein n=1 Tax=Nepenthes gracilis TaxID=150966 RepID=A0AAD3Y302_NEPGR|nr:hypothetical protein Nepgr_029425 [Nepenthes gracilis]
MYGRNKSPFKFSTTSSATSDTESNNISILSPVRHTSSEPTLITPDLDDDSWGRWIASHASSPYSNSSEVKNGYKNNFHDSGGLESQSIQELENYAVYKAEEATRTVNNCLSIAEGIRDDAARTLEALHHQGEQIASTNEIAVNIDRDLSKGEKLLNNLGGIFSKTWKPKKTRNITGPIVTPDYTSQSATKEQRERLSAAPLSKGNITSKAPLPESSNALQKVELEKAKQDDALSDLSSIVDDLKSMAVDMGTELDRQSKALDYLGDDIDELNSRMKGELQSGLRAKDHLRPLECWIASVRLEGQKSSHPETNSGVHLGKSRELVVSGILRDGKLEIF